MKSQAHPRLRHWPASGAHAVLPPLLLVPGAFTGADLWQDRFAPALATAGIDTWAMDFRSAHEGPLRRHRLGLRDFADDLHSAVEHMPQSPVVLGYSLGGRVLLDYLADHALRGVVLINALPPQGVARVLLSYARRHPLSLGMLMSLAVASPVRRWSQRLPAGIASLHSDKTQTDRYVESLRGESLRALAECLRPAPRARQQTPTLVIGMRGDALVPTHVAEQLATALDAELLLLEGLSHTPMIEPGGEQVTTHIVDWMRRLPAV